ncbi:MAG: glycosyl transferase [Bacteroidia bacterium]|nr:glycosyl transferase [Bacteroidia bacterium]
MKTIRHLWYIITKLFLIKIPPELHTNLIFFINSIRLKKRFYYQNINNPKTFNEKINFLKLNCRNSLYPILADKVAVRNYVSKVIGDKYLIPVINTFSNVTEINFAELPNAFILKTNHGSGWNTIIKDKKTCDIRKIKKKFSKWLKMDAGILSREWHYSQIKPCIICEELIGENPEDYKFHCFNGKVKYIQVDEDRFIQHKRTIFNETWEYIPISYCYNINNKIHNKPSKLNEMIEIAEKLSKEIIYVRIDLYLVKNHIYFGEITLHPEGGVGPFDSYESDLKFGENLIL